MVALPSVGPTPITAVSANTKNYSGSVELFEGAFGSNVNTLSNAGAEGSNQPAEKISIVRYIGGDATNWPNEQARDSRINANGGYSDLYARFVLQPDYPEIQGVPADGDRSPMRSYKLERRSWLSRLFVEKSKSIIAVAKIDVLDPDLQLTIPLFSVSYASGGKKKDNWVTTLTSSYVRSPLFRITPGSRFTLDLSSKVSEDATSSGASTALSAITNAVQIVAPQAGVLTELSADENKNRAVALDKAISSLLSYSIDENVEFGRMVWSWQPDSSITISGCAPFLKLEDPLRRTPSQQPLPNLSCAQDKDVAGGVNQLVGRWKLVLTCPQFSAFSSRTLCREDDNGEAKLAVDISTSARRKAVHQQIAETVSDSLVLGLSLAENVSLRSFVRSSDNFTGFIAGKTNDSEAYGKFCAGVMNDLQMQGLTGLDSALGLRASLRLMPEFVADLQDLRGKTIGKGCKDLLGAQGIAL